MLIYFAVYFLQGKNNIFILCNTLYNQHIKKKKSVLLSSFRKKIHNKNNFYVFSYLYLTIYFLSVKTRTHVPFLFFFVVSLGSKLAAVKQNVEIKNHVMLVLINVEDFPSDNLVDV